MTKILETTLRDGSYSIDFQFTALDTAYIAKALEDFGFEFIEIGHGLGLNASNSGKGTAAATDEEYFEAASVLKKAKWGTFFIPGIGRLDDISKAVDYGIGFIRIGTNITELEAGEEYFDYAKKKGLFVSSNLMKSYAVAPSEFARKAKLAKDFGADIVCLVDSAGGMLPQDIEKYYYETRCITDVKLGFHGHNNLQLAVANTLRAAECGAYLVDSSLQGLGRSAGNAPTEVMILILKKKKLSKEFDANAIMDFSEKVIKPLIQEKGIDSLSLTAGYAQFHSSYFSTIFKYAEKHRVDPRELVVELCKRNVVEAPEELVEKLALELGYERERRPPQKLLNKKLLEIDRENVPVTLQEEVELILKDLKNIARKLGRTSILNISTPLIPKDKTSVSRFIQESFSFVVGNVEVSSLEDLKVVLDTSDGEIDAILYDAEQKTPLGGEMLKLVSEKVKKTTLLLYRDTDVWSKALENLVLQLCKGLGRKVLLVGTTRLAVRLANALSEDGYEVYLYKGKTALTLGNEIRLIEPDLCPQIAMDIVIGTTPYSYEVDLRFTNFLSETMIIVDGGIGTISHEMLDYALSKDLKVIRVDWRGALDAEIKAKLNTYELVNTIMGRRYIAGTECVAGGVYGKKNAVILDSINNPKYIVGLADGMGQTKYFLNEEEREIIKAVEKEIFIHLA